MGLSVLSEDAALVLFSGGQDSTICLGWALDRFARVETIKRFALIDQLLTAEDDELTPTMKLKRSFVNKRYAVEINAMYGERAVA